MAARDYSREPYRKLLRNPSPSFRMLDALSQGIGYVLIREADDDGWLPFAIDFEEGLKRLWKLITVPPRQRSIVARCIKDLLDDGMVQHLSDRLMVKNLYEVNRRRDEGPKGPGKGPQKAAGATPSQRSADAEPTLSEPPATPERTVSERSATLERTTGDTPAALERTNETDPSARNDSSEPASRARLQVGRKVGRKVGREEAPPDAPWFDLLGELERGRDLFGLDADLEATSERLAETIAGDPASSTATRAVVSSPRCSRSASRVAGHARHRRRPPARTRRGERDRRHRGDSRWRRARRSPDPELVREYAVAIRHAAHRREITKALQVQLGEAYSGRTAAREVRRGRRVGGLQRDARDRDGRRGRRPRCAGRARRGAAARDREGSRVERRDPVRLRRARREAWRRSSGRDDDRRGGPAWGRARCSSNIATNVAASNHDGITRRPRVLARDDQGGSGFTAWSRARGT
jgi:hypothetical protein